MDPLTNFSTRVPAPKRRLTADETFQWDLAHFLEGRTEACLSRPSWNHAIHYIGHFLVRIGRHDESKPDPRRRRRTVTPRVKINSGGWIRVRNLLEYDRDRELSHSGPHIISATAFLQTFLTDNKGRIVVVFHTSLTLLEITQMITASFLISTSVCLEGILASRSTLKRLQESSQRMISLGYLRWFFIEQMRLAREELSKTVA